MTAGSSRDRRVVVHERMVGLGWARGYVAGAGVVLAGAVGLLFGIAGLAGAGSTAGSEAGGSMPGLASGVVPLGALPGSGAGPAAGLHTASVTSSYGRFPLAFEANAGQSDGRVRYLARGDGYSLFLTGRGAVLSLAGRGAQSRPVPLRIGFAGASPGGAVSGQSVLPGRVNYLLGSDRSRWRTDVPTFSRVGYRDLWPGISASFYGTQGGRLEYDFRVAPGADPARILLSLGGARSLRLGRDGALDIRLPGGVVRQLVPRAYQVVDGARRPVPARYLLRDGRVSVRVGSYDRSRMLVIDPILTYSTYLGGSGVDNANAIAIDALGNAYITGFTSSPNFPTASATTPVQGSNGGGGGDAFITKLNPDGSALVYSTYLGGGSTENALGIAVDALGNAYVTGQTLSSNFPTSSPATPFQTSNRDPANGVAFVAKLNLDGSGLAYSTYLGGTGDGSNGDTGNAITVDALGNAYVTGQTFSSDYPTASPTTPFQAANRGGTHGNAFVTKLNPTGSALVYSTYLGGSGTSGGGDSGTGIAVDALGNAYLIGTAFSPDFPTASPSSPFQTSNRAAGAKASNAFVTRLNPTGSALVYSTYLGGTGTGANGDFGNGIAVDALGNAYVTGTTFSPDFPTASATTPFQTSNHSPAGGNAFVTKVNPTGSALVYSTYLGGTGSDFSSAIAVDALGNAYVTGSTGSSDFPTAASTGSPFQPTPSGGALNAFVTKLNPDGSALLYSTYLGSPASKAGGMGIAVNAGGAMFVTGFTTGSTFPVQSSTSSPFQSHSGGSTDSFVAKFSGVPLAVTGPATGVTQTSAILGGFVNPDGEATSYHFDLGSTTAYGVSTAEVGAGADNDFHSETQAFAAFSPGQTVHYRIVATNPSGTGFGNDQTFRATAGAAAGPGPAQGAQAPTLSGFDMFPVTFRAERTGPSAESSARHQRGSRVTFSLNRAASVVFRVQRRARGRRARGGRCQRPSRRNRGRRRCTRLVSLAGSFTIAGQAGSNGFRFTARLNGRALRPGHYVLNATPTASSQTGSTQAIAFRITRR